MRLFVSVIASLLTLSSVACDAKKDDPLVPAKTKSIGELKQDVKEDTRTPEELEKARREAGFVDPAEEAKANIAAMEKGEREFVKSRLAKYREMTKGLRGHLDAIEKGAKAWAKAKKPQAAFDKFNKGYKEDKKEFMVAYNDLTENGIRGGAIAATLAKTLRAWGDVNNDLGPEIGKAENFDKSLTDLRALLGEVDKELDAIEKDETLKTEEPEGDKSDGDKKSEKKGGKKKGG
ncbi:MAG: hypothetical protein JKY37_11150 [Nannocystaceae bacterium]|nr:hypothetical protein [Nannocystaceae bacterium]